VGVSDEETETETARGIPTKLLPSTKPHPSDVNKVLLTLEFGVADVDVLDKNPKIRS
jgi:hypothetical protein